MGELEPLFSFQLGSFTFELSPYVVIQWIIILGITLVAWWITKDLKVRPKEKKQIIAETIYDFLNKAVKENMGGEYVDLVPFVGSFGLYILTMNLTGLIGVPAPTKSFSVTVALALITFYMVQAYAIKRVGLKHYFVGYAKPMAMVLPMNIIERIMLPVSLALRLFGNVFAATILVDLVYEGLGGLGMGFIGQIGIPIPLHAYFDIFDGVIQMVIFVMLTMINIKVTCEH